MDSRILIERLSNLIAQKNFQGAEELLLEKRKKASAANDAQLMGVVLSELIELYSLLDPPLWSKAEALSIERERLAPSAYSRLQTAMILHHGARDYIRAVPKLEEAISQGKAECDDKTLYTALSLLGQASLGLGNKARAIVVLNQLEQLVAKKASFVVGDETPFLESMVTRGLEIGRVKRLASTLAKACRDPDFKERLNSLASAG